MARADLLLLFLLFLLAALLSFAIYFLSLLLVPRSTSLEKGSAYECGFDPFEEDTRGRFEVRFYLVAILFIIFDLEISFLFPWSLALPSIGPFGYGTMAAFLLLLTVGFYYEWRKGALEW